MMDKNAKNSLRRHGIGLIVAIFVMALSFFLSNKVSQVVDNKIQSEFSSVSTYLSEIIEDKIDLYKNISLSGVSLHRASSNVDRSEWDEFMKNQYSVDEQSIKAIEFIERVSLEEKERFIESIRKEGFDDFNIYPGLNKNEYYVVNYIYPFESNKRAFGFDLSSNSDRLSALEDARDTDNFTITPPVNLVLDGENSYSFIGFVPVYENGVAVSDLDSRQKNIKGFSSIVFSLDSVLEDILKETRSTLGLHYSIEDVDSGIVFFDSFNEEDNEDADNSGFVKNIEVGSRIWRLSSHPSNYFIGKFKNDLLLPNVILVIGFILSVGSFAFVLVTLGSRRKALELAESMTSELKIEKDKAEQQKDKVEKSYMLTKKLQKEAEERAEESDRLNKIMVDRELKMAEMKKEIDRLKKVL